MAQVDELLAEEVDAIREEYIAQQSQGWLRKKQWILSRLQDGMEKVGLGQVPDEKDRLRCEGFNVAMKAVLDRDDQIAQAWADYCARQDEPEPQDEGGELGISYEAAG